MTVDWWSPSSGLPDASSFVSAYGKNGTTIDISTIIAMNSAAHVLFDAISQAQSLDPNAINTALGKINKTYSVGHIQFGANHAAPITVGMDQWQGGEHGACISSDSGSRYSRISHTRSRIMLQGKEQYTHVATASHRWSPSLAVCMPVRP